VPKRIFISYRRDDTAAAAGRLYDRLWRLLSKSNVFFDISAIEGGENFETKIVSEIERSDAALVLIGKKWLEPSQKSGKPRIWDADDYVRAEVRASLQRSILVLPVLVDGTQMPSPEQLPDDIRAVTARNALLLRHESFDDDAENILRVALGAAPRERPWDEKGKLVVKIAYSATGAIAGLILLGLAALVHHGIFARPLSTSVGNAITTLLLVTAGLLGATAGFSYEARRRAKRLVSRR
jgi:hypothetical protein